MKTSLHRGSFTAKIEEAKKKKDEAIKAFKELVRDDKYKIYRDRLLSYKEDVMSALIALQCADTGKYATDIALTLTELRILDRILGDLKPFEAKDEKGESSE